MGMWRSAEPQRGEEKRVGEARASGQQSGSGSARARVRVRTDDDDDEHSAHAAQNDHHLHMAQLCTVSSSVFRIERAPARPLRQDT